MSDDRRSTREIILIVENDVKWMRRSTEEALDKGSKRMDEIETKVTEVQKKVWMGTGIAIGASTLIGWLKAKMF